MTNLINALAVRKQEREVLEAAVKVRDCHDFSQAKASAVESLLEDISLLEDLQTHDTPAIVEARYLYWAADTLRTMATKAGSRERNRELGNLADAVEMVAEEREK